MACLDDLADMAHGWLDLADATGEEDWLELAQRGADELMRRFWDSADGGFWTAPPPWPGVPDCRAKDPFESALPNASAVATRVLFRLAARTGDPRYREWA